MKVREEPAPVFDPPPLPLRRWYRRVTGSGKPAGEPVGAEVHRSREEWLAARRRWERQHGQTIAEWWAGAEREARAELRMLEMLPYKPDPDEEPDPDAW